MSLTESRNQLNQSILYVDFNHVVRKLRQALYKKTIVFSDSIEQRFAKEVIYRIMEESLAYISNINEDLFFASNHHLRALLEMYASIEYTLSDTGRRKRFLERFGLYPTIVFHKVFHQHDDSLIKLSKKLCEKFLFDYSELKPEIFAVFNTPTSQELLELKTWRGNCTIENLFSQCPKPEVIKSDYAKLCLFSHVSSVLRRSETEVFQVFDQSAETMLLCAVRYAVFSYVCIKQQSLLTKTSQDLLDDIFLPFTPTFVKAHKDRGFLLNLDTTNIVLQPPKST